MSQVNFLRRLGRGTGPGWNRRLETVGVVVLAPVADGGLCPVHVTVVGREPMDTQNERGEW